MAVALLRMFAGKKPSMRRLIAQLMLVTGLVMLTTCDAVAGLTVSLTVNGEQVELHPLYQGTGTPDNNGQYENGYVAVAGVGVNVDDDRRFDLFIDALSLTSEKTSSEGKVTTINISTRYFGTSAVDVVIRAFDDFGLPFTTDGTPLLITSAFLSVINPGLPITLDTTLDDNTAVSVNSVTGTHSEFRNTTGPAPFRLESEFRFSIAPNSTVAFMAESIASGVNTAVVPELASLAAWSVVLGGLGIVVMIRRRSALRN